MVGASAGDVGEHDADAASGVSLQTQRSHPDRICQRFLDRLAGIKNRIDCH
jgi:hypothetical protein